MLNFSCLQALCWWAKNKNNNNNNNNIFAQYVHQITCPWPAVLFSVRTLQNIMLAGCKRYQTSLRRSSWDHNTDAGRLLLCPGAGGRYGWKGGCYQRDRRTNGLTDTRPLHRSCTAYYVGGVKKNICTLNNDQVWGGLIPVLEICGFILRSQSQ